MKRRELHVHYIKYLRGEASAEEVKLVEKFRAESPQHEAEFQAVALTLEGIAKSLADESVDAPGAPFENDIMRKVRAEAEAGRGIRGFLRELKHYVVLILGICSLAAAFLIPLGPTVQQQQSYFTNQSSIHAGQVDVAAQAMPKTGNLLAGTQGIGVMLICGLCGIALMVVGATGRTRSTKSFVVLGAGLVVLAVRIFVFEMILTDMVNLKLFP